MEDERFDDLTRQIGPDQALVEEIDPNANEAFRRIERRALRERGQSFFSPPGSGFPPRQRPDLGEALE